MVDLTIYSYGYSKIIFNTLEAIALFRNLKSYPIMVGTVAILAGLTYAIKMVAARSDSEWRQLLRQIIGMVVFINLLLMPIATMRILDKVDKNSYEVANIPLAFALPVGIIENFGHILTVGFEQSFATVGGASSHNYYYHGTVFGARLKKEVMQAKVRDPEFISNMSNFIERCVMVPAMIGNKLTKEEVASSTNLWKLIKDKSGTFTRTPMTKDGKRVSPAPTCKEAVTYFETKFAEAIKSNMTSWIWKFQGAGEDVVSNAKEEILHDNLSKQIRNLYGTNTNVEDILKHNMMINSLSNYHSGAYPLAKASMQQEAGGLISGDLADKTLTGSLAVMKVIIYGSFIFLFPLLIISGGISKYKAWITAAFSLALWPSLYSMINMIIDFAYQPATIVSYSSWASEYKKFDSIASTAANLSLMIPFLSFWITRMGEGGFMHLAGSIMASASGASAALASEKASGSRSWDNESIGNKSYNNHSSNKYDDSMQHVSGSARSMRADGSTEMVTPGGKVLYFGGSGQTASTGESSYHQGEGIMANYQTGMSDEIQAMKSEEARYSKAQEKLYEESASALVTIMENSKTDHGFNIDTSTESGREIMKAVNKVNELSKGNEANWRQNAEAHMKADYTAGGMAAKALGIEVGVGGSITANNESSQTNAQTDRVSDETGVHARDSVNTRTSETDNFLASHGIDKNSQDSLRESYQESERLEKSVAAHKDKIDSYKEAMDHTRSHSSEYSKDMYQDVLDAYQQKHGVSAHEAQKAVSEGTAPAKAIFRELTGSKAQELLDNIHSKGKQIVNSDEVSRITENNQINNDIGDKRNQFAQENNIKTDSKASEEEIAQQGGKYENVHLNKKHEKEAEYDQTKHENDQAKGKAQKQMDKYEEDRIGNGKVSTLGGYIDGFGRPSQNKDDLGDSPGRPYRPKAPENKNQSVKP